MTRRLLMAMIVAVGLAGCGSENENQNQSATGQNGSSFQNVEISRNPDSSFSMKAGDQTLRNISSVQVKDPQPSKDVSAFLAEPVADDSGGGKLCCTSCSLSNGVLICTGCVSC